MFEEKYRGRAVPLKEFEREKHGWVYDPDDE